MLRGKKQIVFGALVACIVCYGGAANASLLGDEITGELFFSGGATNYFLPGNGFVPVSACQDASANVIVSDPNPACGREFQFESSFSLIEVGVGGSEVVITHDFLGDVTFNNWEINLFDLDWLPVPGIITGIVEIQDTFSGGVTASFGVDSLSFSWSGGAEEEGNRGLAHFRIETAHASVPEPTTLLLLGLGLAGLGFARKRLH